MPERAPKRPGRKRECQRRAREGQKEPEKARERQRPERAREESRMPQKWTLNFKGHKFPP